jgi:hypothetical protein
MIERLVDLDLLSSSLRFLVLYGPSAKLSDYPLLFGFIF